MNWRKISFGTIGIAGIVGLLVAEAVDKYYSNKVDEKALEQRDEATTYELNNAQEIIDKVDHMMKRESKELNDQIRQWKKLNNYDGKLRDIHQTVVSELEDFKESINYFERKQEIIDAAEEELEAFKDSIDYEYEIDSLEDDIEKAEAIYKKRCRLFDISGSNDDDVSETVSSLKSAEKEIMDEAVKKAKGKIKELEAQVSSEKSKIDRKKQQQLKALESEISATKNQLDKRENDESNVIRQNFREMEEQFRNEIQNKRTEDETKSLEKYNESHDTVDRIYREDAERATSIYENAKNYEAWSEYLTSIGCPKWFFASVSAIPFVAICYIGYSYVKFVVMTVKNM